MMYQDIQCISRVASSRISQFLTRISFKDLNKKGVFNTFENQGTVLSILLFFSTVLSIPCSVFSLRLFTLFSFQICYPFFPIFLHLLLPLMFYYYSICSLSVSFRVFRSFYLLLLCYLFCSWFCYPVSLYSLSFFWQVTISDMALPVLSAFLSFSLFSSPLFSFYSFYASFLLFLLFFLVFCYFLSSLLCTLSAACSLQSTYY